MFDQKSAELIRCLAQNYAIYADAACRAEDRANDADWASDEWRDAVLASARKWADMSGTALGDVYRIALTLAAEGY